MLKVDERDLGKDWTKPLCLAWDAPSYHARMRAWVSQRIRDLGLKFGDVIGLTVNHRHQAAYVHVYIYVGVDKTHDVHWGIPLMGPLQLQAFAIEWWPERVVSRVDDAEG